MSNSCRNYNTLYDPSGNTWWFVSEEEANNLIPWANMAVDGDALLIQFAKLCTRAIARAHKKLRFLQQTSTKSVLHRNIMKGFIPLEKLPGRCNRQAGKLSRVQNTHTC